MKTQERSSFESGILRRAFKSKICWLKYNRNERVCNQIPLFLKESFQVWLFLTVLCSVQWFSVPFWAVTNTVWVGCIWLMEKSLLTCCVEVYQSLSVLQVCCCPAPALRSSYFTQVKAQIPLNPEYTTSCKEYLPVKVDKRLSFLHPFSTGQNM